MAKAKSSRKKATPRKQVRSASKTKAKPRASAAAGPSAREQFLKTFEKEHATTMRVLGAVPPDKGDFRPHARSNTAKDLAHTFIIEQQLMLRALKNELKIGQGGGFPKFDTLGEAIERFHRDSQDVIATVRKTSEKDFTEGKVPFYTGPKQLGEYSKADFAWFMLLDQIHHRGQMSIYVRMCEGKVPSIYGPSADEPWT
jgi:uncharacterized damage-inducible protein DinB